MEIKLVLPDWNTETWWQIGIGVYLALCWLVIAPWITRSDYKNSSVAEKKRDEGFLLFLWFLSPVVLPLVLLYFVVVAPISLLVYGTLEEPK